MFTISNILMSLTISIITSLLIGGSFYTTNNKDNISRKALLIIILISFVTIFTISTIYGWEKIFLFSFPTQK